MVVDLLNKVFIASLAGRQIRCWLN